VGIHRRRHVRELRAVSNTSKERNDKSIREIRECDIVLVRPRPNEHAIFFAMNSLEVPLASPVQDAQAPAASGTAAAFPPSPVTEQAAAAVGTADAATMSAVAPLLPAITDLLLTQLRNMAPLYKLSAAERLVLSSPRYMEALFAWHAASVDRVARSVLRAVAAGVAGVNVECVLPTLETLQVIARDTAGIPLSLALLVNPKVYAAGAVAYNVGTHMSLLELLRAHLADRGLHVSLAQRSQESALTPIAGRALTVFVTYEGQ